MKLLLIDDHPLFAIGFAHALSSADLPIEIETANGLEAGIALARRRADFDIVLIDYRLGAEDGLTGLRRFATLFPLMARALISGDESLALVAQAREAGARAFLGKSWGLDALRSALAQVAAGGEVFTAAPPPAASNRHAPTARQLEVLALLAQGQPNKRIALSLGIAERTVKLHVTALLELLAADNRTHLLVRARESRLI